MKSSILFILLFNCLLVLPVSCSLRKPAPEPVIIENTKTIREVIKDTVFEVKQDSAYYQSWIECLNGKPVIKENSERSKPGSFIKVPVVTLTSDGKLSVNARSEALQLFKSWREKYITENSTKIIPPVYIEKPLQWYQKTLMWIGAISLVLCAIGLVLKIKK